MTHSCVCALATSRTCEVVFQSPLASSGPCLGSVEPNPRAGADVSRCAQMVCRMLRWLTNAGVRRGLSTCTVATDRQLAARNPAAEPAAAAVSSTRACTAQLGTNELVY